MTSNKCNLKCRMCSSRSSTAWIKDEEKLGLRKVYPHKSWDKPPMLNSDKLQPDKNTLFNNLFQNPSLFKDLEVLSIRGGEPFYEPLNNRFIDQLEKIVSLSDIKVDLSTNGSVLDKNFLNRLLKFKSIQLQISIESISNYSLIRGFGDIEKVKMFLEEMKKHKKINLEIVCCVSMYNIFDLHEILRLGEISNIPCFFNNIVTTPSFLSINNLPESDKKRAIEYINNLNLYGKDSILSALNTPEHEHNKFIKFNQKLNNIYVDK